MIHNESLVLKLNFIFISLFFCSIHVSSFFILLMALKYSEVEGEEEEVKEEEQI